MQRTPSLRKIKNEPQAPNAIASINLAKRVIDTTLHDVREVVADTIIELLDGALAGKEPAEVMPRAGAAEYLCISLGQLDLLCRRDHDPIPYTLAGDARRFFRADLRDWLLRQRAVKP